MIQRTWGCRYLFKRVVLFSLDKHPVSGITGSQGSSTFNILEKLQTLAHSGRASRHSHQQCKSSPLSPRPRQHLSFLVFFVIVNRCEVISHRAIYSLVFIMRALSSSEVDTRVAQDDLRMRTACYFCRDGHISDRGSRQGSPDTEPREGGSLRCDQG